MTAEAAIEIVEESTSQVITLEFSLEFSTVELRKDDKDTEYMSIRALALDEGVWNGIYFNAEDISEKLNLLDGRRVLVSHEFENPDDVKGWVESISDDGFTNLNVFDPETMARVKSGELNAVSVGVQIQQTNGIATIMDFNEISLTGNPACKTCAITDFTVATLEEEEPDMEDEPQETTENEELCCEPELEETQVESDFDKSEVDLENENLRAQLNDMQETITVLTAHKEHLESERREAEIDSRVSIILDEGRFRPSHATELHTFLLSLSDEQLTLWEGAEQGLGPVVPLDDLADSAEFSPDEKSASELAQTKKDYRKAMGYKEE